MSDRYKFHVPAQNGRQQELLAHLKIKIDQDLEAAVLVADHTPMSAYEALTAYGRMSRAPSDMFPNTIRADAFFTPHKINELARLAHHEVVSTIAPALMADMVKFQVLHQSGGVNKDEMIAEAEKLVERIDRLILFCDMSCNNNDFISPEEDKRFEEASDTGFELLLSLSDDSDERMADESKPFILGDPIYTYAHDCLWAYMQTLSVDPTGMDDILMIEIWHLSATLWEDASVCWFADSIVGMFATMAMRMRD